MFFSSAAGTSEDLASSIVEASPTERTEQVNERLLPLFFLILFTVTWTF